MLSKCEGGETGYEARLRQCRARICSCCACIGRAQNLRTFERKSRRRRRRSCRCWRRIHKSFEVVAADKQLAADRGRDSPK
jgi:hypothetical protein